MAEAATTSQKSAAGSGFIGSGLPDEIAQRSSLVVLHVSAAPPFVVDVVLVPSSCEDEGEGSDACAAAYAAMSGGALTELLRQKQDSFEARLGKQLGLTPTGGGSGGLRLRGAPLGKREFDFACAPTCG